MSRFKPCPLFIFLSPEKLRFCLSCNFVAKVLIIFETTKLFSNFFVIFYQFSSKTLQKPVYAPENPLKCLRNHELPFLCVRNPTSPCASRNFNERELPPLSMLSGSSIICTVMWQVTHLPSYPPMTGAFLNPFLKMLTINHYYYIYYNIY